MSEYLADDLSKKLAQYLNLPDETDSKKRKLTSPKDGTDEKRQKKDSLEGDSLPRNRVLDLTKPEKVCHFDYCPCSSNTQLSLLSNIL